MNSDDRTRIDNYENILLEKTNFKKVYTLLLRWKVIPIRLKAFKNIATESKSDKEKNKILYDVIKSQGPKAFSYLKRALQLSNPELFQQFEGRKWNFQGEQWHHSPVVYDLSNAEIRGLYRIVSFTANRDGWRKEVQNLETTFRHLHFEGTTCLDPDRTEDMFTDFTKVDNAGCYIFALSGHGIRTNGGEAVLHTDKSYKLLKEILLEICEAPALLNKPKIVILQLCRGESESLSISRTVHSPTSMPSFKDTIILRPCLPGHVAYRDRVSGGWFITQLTTMIQKYARTKDIEEIMIEVCNKFAEMRASGTELYEHVHESRYMVPCAYTYSFKKFYFVLEEERN